MVLSIAASINQLLFTIGIVLTILPAILLSPPYILVSVSGLVLVIYTTARIAVHRRKASHDQP